MIPSVPRSNYLRLYEPRAKMPCLCGSGQKFKKCCSGEYKISAKDNAHDTYNAGLYREALIECRLYITWYILCHKAHTIPFLESETKESKELFQIDIGALADLVNLLMLCYERTGKHKQFPQTLDALQNAITDVRWYDRVAYFRALWQLFDGADDRLIYHELKKISDLENTKDLNVLTLYLQVFPEKSFSRKIEIIDRILASNPPPGILLQYQTLKGVQYYLLNDIDAARSIVAAAVAKFKSEGVENPSTYDLGILANSLYILGEISDNRTCFVESQAYLKKMLESPNIKPTGTASIYSDLGHSLLSQGMPAEAKDYFIKSLGIDDAEITKVFLGRAWLNLQEFEKAEDVLSQINTDKIDEREKYDFAITWTILALETRKIDLLTKANSMLTAAVSEGPLFIELKDGLLSEVQRVMKNGDVGIVPKILRLLNRYLLLQPNIIGLGVNINNILDDAGRKSGKKKNL